MRLGQNIAFRPKAASYPLWLRTFPTCWIAMLGSGLEMAIPSTTKTASVAERSRPCCLLICRKPCLVVAARGVNLQVAGGDGRRSLRARADEQHRGVAGSNLQVELVVAAAWFQVVDGTRHEG